MWLRRDELVRELPEPVGIVESVGVEREVCRVREGPESGHPLEP